MACFCTWMSIKVYKTNFIYFRQPMSKQFRCTFEIHISWRLYFCSRRTSKLWRLVFYKTSVRFCNREKFQICWSTRNAHFRHWKRKRAQATNGWYYRSCFWVKSLSLLRANFEFIFLSILVILVINGQNWFFVGFSTLWCSKCSVFYVRFVNHVT